MMKPIKKSPIFHKQRRFAILTDIHGNIFALDKALEIVKDYPDVDQVICLGDCFALGSSPVQVLEKLQALDNCVFIRGNHDRYLVERIWEYDRPTIEGMDPDDPVCIGIIADEKWTAEQLGQAGTDFVQSMRLSYFEHINGTYVEFTHAWFGRDDMPPTLEEGRQWRNHANQRHPNSSRYILVHGHTHLPRQESIGNLSVFCQGSTGLPFDEDQRGSVAFLTVAQDDIQWDVVRFEYDLEKAINHMIKTKPPFYQNLANTLRYAGVHNDLDS